MNKLAAMKFKLKKLRLVLEKIDLFKTPISLRIQNKSKLSSKTGIMLSLIVYGLLLYSFIYMSTDVFNKANPNMLKQTLIQSARPRLVLNQQNFTFAVGLTDIYGSPIMDETIFSFIVEAVGG